MDANALREFAREVANQTIYDHWLFWVLLIVSAGIAGYLASFLGKYAAKRGENFATKADFRDLLQQTRLTTQEVENIRSEISLGEWTQKEYRSLRKTKLEEFIFAIHDTQHWILREHHRVVFESNTEEDAPEQPATPIIKAVTIGHLYFPELRASNYTS